MSKLEYIEHQTRYLPKLSPNATEFIYPLQIPSLFLFLEGNFFRFFSSEDRKINFHFENFSDYIVENEKKFVFQVSFFETPYYSNLQKYFSILDCPYKLTAANFLVCFQWLTQRALSYKLKDKLDQLKESVSPVYMPSSASTETSSAPDILGHEYTEEIDQLGSIVKLARSPEETNFSKLFIYFFLFHPFSLFFFRLFEKNPPYAPDYRQV